MNEPKLTDDDDGDTTEEEEVEPKITDDVDGDTPEVEESFSAGSIGVKECCDDSDDSNTSEIPSN